MKDLQAITDEWGQWMLNKYGGNEINFTASVNYNSHEWLRDYLQKQVIATVQNIKYETGAPSPENSYSSSKITNYNNNSSSAQRVAYNDTFTTDKSFQWSITESLSIGLSATVSAGPPEIAQVSGTIYTDLNLSSTQGETKTESQTWNIDMPIEIAPFTQLKASMVVTKQTYNINWTTEVNLKGSVAIWFDKRVAIHEPDNYHYCWFIPIATVFRNCKDNNIISTEGYEIGVDSVQAITRGVFTGSQGVELNINVSENKIKPSDGQTITNITYIVNAEPLP